MKLDMLYYQNISGPKRRITHTAKVDVSHFVSLFVPHLSLPASLWLSAALNIKLHCHCKLKYILVFVIFCPLGGTSGQSINTLSICKSFSKPSFFFPII